LHARLRLFGQPGDAEGARPGSTRLTLLRINFVPGNRGEPHMQGLMMNMPLLVSGMLKHADRHHADTEIVSKTMDGSVHRYTYRDAHARARKLANALQRLGVKPGARIATLAWNSHRHFEIYYAVAGSGAVIHTINPRLFPEQIAYIGNHAEDQYIFFD